VIAELDWAARISGEQSVQPLPPLDERQPAQVGPVEEQEIERKHHQPVRRILYGSSQRGEVGQSVLVLHDDFTIDQG
jgi:hypothetical protein